MLRSVRVTTVAVALSTLIAGSASSSHLPSPRWKPRVTIEKDKDTHLDVFSNGRGFALQHGSPLYTTTDYGRTWDQRPAPPGAYEVEFASPRTGYALTTDQSGREILRTTDGGETWNAIPKPIALPNGASDFGAYFDEIDAPSDNVVILGGVVSRYYPECRWEGRAAVYRSDNGGLTFTWTEFPYDGVIHQLNMLDDLHGVMVASEWVRTSDPATCSSTASPLSIRALVTHDGGRNWSVVAEEAFTFTAPPSHVGLHSVGMSSPDRVLIGLTDGTIRTSHDGGKTFVRAKGTRNGRYPNVDPHYLSRIDVIEFATPDVGYATSAHGGVWRTRDGGLTWKQEKSPQSSGSYSFSSALAVANTRRAVVAGNTKVSDRVPPH